MTEKARTVGGSEPLVEEILGGSNRGLQMLAARGLVPLAPPELIAVQVGLTASADAEIAEVAKTAISELDAKITADLVLEGVSDEVVAYLGRTLKHPTVLKAIVGYRTVSRELLVELAESLDEELQELLLLRQDAIIETPAILDALERNPSLGRFGKRRIREYREHLLPRERSVPRKRAELEAEAEAVTDAELLEAINEARQRPAEGEEEEDYTGLTESQIRTLAVPIRMKLSRGASKTLRGILIRDPNPMVATAVLESNPMGESEIEQIASNRSVVNEVLEAIGNHRSWTRKYGVVAALVKNPRTPVGIAVRLLPRVAVRDLQSLARDRNVSDAVRSGAARLYKIKRG
jgi:hypothetical protein